MKQKNFFRILLFLIFTKSLSFSQTIIDDFTDGNFTSNQMWTGSTAEFSVITDATLPNGIASTDGSFLASNATQSDVSLAFASTEVSEWRFSLGSPNFSPSNSNYIGVVLMASASFSGEMVANSFQGYYLRVGTSGSSDPIALYRKTGSGTSKVGDFPSSPSFGNNALQNGLNIRVTRSSSGVFELFYNTGFQYDSLPTISAGTLTNNVYSSSSYFGVYQHIGSTSTDRRVYIDNIELGVVTWDGSESSDWATAENWDTNSIPTSTDNTIIPSNLTNYPTVTTAETIKSLIMGSGSTLVATNASFTVTNSAVYIRNLAQAVKWYLMSSPVISESYDDSWISSNSIASGQNNNKGISTYDNTSFDTDSDGAGTADTETGYWRFFQSGGTATTFEKGKGYGIIRSASGDISFTGTGIYSTSQTATISQSASNYNLVGNPFTAFLNLGDFFADNATANLLTSNTLWVWNANSGSYDAKLSGTHTGYEIAPGQAIFVEAGTAAIASDNLTFDINDISHQTTDTFQKTLDIRSEINLTISDENSNVRNASIYFIEGTTEGFDNGFDGKLFGGVSTSFAIFSQLLENNQDVKYQIQSLPTTLKESVIIPLGVVVSFSKTQIEENISKEITIKASLENLTNKTNVYLEDRLKGTFTLLNDNNSFSFTATEAINESGRFYLHTTSEVLSTEDSIMNNNISMYSNKKMLYINGLDNTINNVSVFNLLGKQLISKTYSDAGNKTIYLSSLVNGVYFVKLENSFGTITKKIILK